MKLVVKILKNLPFRCSQCGKRYKQKANLNRHLRYECGIVPKYKCPYCSHMTKRKFSLKMHIGVVHNVVVDCDSIQ
ncbi:hypothetical protein HHI36_020020 [Cryptolaemus montrouzieri]|uniref:C2H2-type domain-containing protein n=1 Tax=Cryptolaemus montrouzieri TaxID=559131 RepID=A0ABD2N978_9CUCU